MNKPHTRILFVDDEEELLAGLQNALRKYRNEWDVHFANSGAEALQKVAEMPFAAIVTDMRMPKMDGAALLDRLSNLRTDAVRMVMTGQTDPATTVRIVGTTHRMLSKPCSLEELQATLRIMTTLRSLIPDDASRMAVSHAQYFILSPTRFTEFQALLENPDAALADIAKLVRQEPGLAAKVLQLVHAGFLGKIRGTMSIESAVSQVGADVIRMLPPPPPSVLKDDPELTAVGMTNDRFARHAVRMAQVTQRIAPASVDRETAYTAGLLSVAGIGTIAAEIPHESAEAIGHAVRNKVPIHVAERAIYDYDHAVIGAYVLGLWGMPAELVEAIRYHHDPLHVGPKFSLAGALHLADALVTSTFPISEQHRIPFDASVDKAYLNACGAGVKLNEWKAYAASL